ncbi:cation-translocating P-type ATPase [Lacihabitans sp. CS3-21]|uniref:cation-translocating P-type ATPase n=1 Tax=Lacihabitans sp. CS3-21 TaxID=2487332 RepID=UPI0020CFC369|nr:cation-translocating P-type ATPase [Lacihabitans sp. CS3-21]MCP9745528.1 cation-translocating P-type ATPase [Lacihabitans sp. CS3-21]
MKKELPLAAQGIKGLNPREVLVSREKNGKNLLDFKKENSILSVIRRLAQDPMVIILLVASIIYFISDKTADAIFLASAILFQISISFFQDARSTNALEKLKEFIVAKSKVIRNGKVEEIKSEDLVLGDVIIIEEGMSIPADATIIHSNDFLVNESILTGESLAVEKNKENNQVFKGTSVVGGLGIAQITAIGNETSLGKIGKSLEGIKEEKTPLENQISNFVKKMAFLGGIVFFVVWAINYYNNREILNSLLQSLTLAMSILPEEIPVAFTTFMALGAWRLMKSGIVVKQMKTVETLGSATVICTDKTGTLTENIMDLAKLYDFESNVIFETNQTLTETNKNLIRTAMFASEPIPFDPMEVALHNAYKIAAEKDERPNFKIIKEYPLGGTPPMMTHVFENKSDEIIIAAKGSPEAIIHVSYLSEEDKLKIENAIDAFTSEGFRVLGVAEAHTQNKNFPKSQQEFKFNFKGILAFYDPPKKNINKVLSHFYESGIKVKIITGDSDATTISIAKQIGFRGFESHISGKELMLLSDKEFDKKVMDVNIFTRMFPEAKLRIINSLKKQNEVVAMTGDGVNDGPALKSAHIGIAMGKKGSELAKDAASLILMNDDLSKMVKAVSVGRKIYTNLKKAIQYIISIHIPIILTVFVPLALGWIYPNIFSPVHVIFLELIMGPTCSIIYENEPIEKNTMKLKPRPLGDTFFSWKELTTSIVQGLAITIGTLGTYQYAISQNLNEPTTRAMVFTTLIISNVVLTLVNRSFYYSIITTLKYKNNLVMLIIAITLGITSLILFIKPFSKFFEFESLSFYQLSFCLIVGSLSVIWYEGVKLWKRKTSKNLN